MLKHIVFSRYAYSLATQKEKMKYQYSDIARCLSAEIEQGKFTAGSLFPKRNDLAARFNVTRSTVDRAVRVLVDKGYLESKRGSGTIVRSENTLLKIAYICSDSRIGHIDYARNIELVPMFYSSLKTRSDRKQLKNFDGVVWSMPSQDELDWSRELPESLPQIILNRHIPEFNYVSTDHKGTIYQITKKRLKSCKNAVPVYIEPEASHKLVTSMRYAGFVDACKDTKSYYETLYLPKNFDDSVNELIKLRRRHEGKPLLLVSSALATTGTVCAWARQEKLQWKKDVFYSDFDNNMPKDVWGVKVTSFVQDYPLISDIAFEKISELVKRKCKTVQILLPAAFIDGET